MQILSRPDGELVAVREKVKYRTMEGDYTIYPSISFEVVRGRIDGKEVTVERPIEFFIEGMSDHWVGTTCMNLSLLARSGFPLEKALENMRSVVWPHGSVRCGEYVKPDGTTVPRFHSSDVAAIGYAFQRMLARRGFLTDDGRGVGVRELVAIQAARHKIPTAQAEMFESQRSTPPARASTPAPGGFSRKACKECGAHTVAKRDGCEACESCGWAGSCG